jgi:hypothetical protein
MGRKVGTMVGSMGKEDLEQVVKAQFLKKEALEFRQLSFRKMQGSEYSLVAEHLASTLEALGSSFSTTKKNQKTKRIWWCTPVIPALRRLRQEDLEF